MITDSSPRFWRRLERPALWATLAVSFVIAGRPLGEWARAWSTQRALEATWRQARSHPHSSRSSHVERAGASRLGEQVSALWPLTRLTADTMKLDAVVVEGTDAASLKEGPGHEIGTSLPGGPNCVIAAHRNAYGWWFYRLNELNSGDLVELETPDHRYLYLVAAKRQVSVRDTSILHPPARKGVEPRLTLYSCTLPKTSKRLVVIANLLGSEEL